MVLWKSDKDELWRYGRDYGEAYQGRFMVWKDGNAHGMITSELLSSQPGE